MSSAAYSYQNLSDNPSLVVLEDTIEISFISKMESMKYEYYQAATALWPVPRIDRHHRNKHQERLRHSQSTSSFILQTSLACVKHFIRRALPGQQFYSTQLPICLWFF